MRISRVLQPVQDLKDATFKNNKGNIEASKRPTPTMLSYAFSYARATKDILQQQKIRKTRNAFVMEQVNQHRSREKERSSRIRTE